VIIDGLAGGFYLITTALLAPVLLALLAMLAWTLCLLGGFAREWLGRAALREQLAGALAAACRGDGGVAWHALGRIGAGVPARFTACAPAPGDAAGVRLALATVEQDISAAIAKLTLIIRLGPMLGLMGTLIPLGPALAGLAHGDVQVLAGNLVIAFTATVVGLLLSGLAYAMSVARRLWYARDLDQLEALCARLAPEDA
jgi:biopolymer transport protein ExbB/TolQ